MTPHRRNRMTAEDWETGALDLIAEKGVNALAVEALARKLGVTKGSFYWHFATREALLEASLARWAARDEYELHNRVDSIREPRARLREMFHWIISEAPLHRVHAALLQALDLAPVARVMSRVCSQQMKFLDNTYQEAGLSRSEATHRAVLAYAVYIGFLQLSLMSDVPAISQFDEYLEYLMATLIP